MSHQSQCGLQIKKYFKDRYFYFVIPWASSNMFVKTKSNKQVILFEALSVIFNIVACRSVAGVTKTCFG